MSPKIAQSKYRNVKTVVDGMQFDSKKEAARYGQLKLLQRAGKISDLRLQPKFDIVVCGTKICKYIADFEYIENGIAIVEDVKGKRTREYILKKKLVKAVLKIDILET